MSEEVKKTLSPVGEIKPDFQLNCARFTPCGKVLVGAGFDQQVHRWDFQGDEVDPPERPELAAVGGHSGWVSALGFVAERSWAISADTWGRLQAWPYLDADPKPVWNIEDAHDGWIRDLAVSPDGLWVATCGRDQIVRRFATDDGRLLSEWSGHTEDIFSMGIHPEGNQVVTGDLRGRVIQWQVATGEIEREFAAPELYEYDRIQDVGGVRRLIFDPKGEHLVMAGGDLDTGNFVKGTARIAVINWSTGKELCNQLIGVNNKDVFAHDVAFHSEGFLVIITSGQPGSGSIFLHRPGDEAPFLSYNKKTSNCHSVSLHPDGCIAVAATSSGSNGNGRRLKEGLYVGNTSPILLFRLT
jgi:WD40 repeat protein